MKQNIPICIPSYSRYEHCPTLNTLSRYNIDRECFVFVRIEQMENYRRQYPQFVYVPITNVNGLCSTRNLIFDFCVDNGYSYYIDMDDDITSVSYNVNKNAIGAIQDARVAFSVLEQVAVNSFETYEDLVLVGAIQRAFANYKPHKLYYNKGDSPRQLYVVDVEKSKRSGITRNLAWERTGDDTGLWVEILRHKKDMATTNLVLFSPKGGKYASTIRNSSNQALLHEIERSLLESFGVVELFREHIPRDLSSPSCFNVNFREYSKKYGRESFTIE